MKKQYTHPLVIAITGGIGSGQSTVCKFFEEWNCRVVNADYKAKEIINKNRSLQKQLQQEFGRDVISNRRLDRKRLAQAAFKDELQTSKLNRLVHPRMVESLVEEMEKARFSKKYAMIIVDAALIYEISIENNFDVVVVVTAPMEMRRQRVYKRDRMTKQQFMERVDKQIPLEDKVSWADLVIDNNGSIDDLKIKTRRVFNKLMDMQRKKQLSLKKKIKDKR